MWKVGVILWRNCLPALLHRGAGECQTRAKLRHYMLVLAMQTKSKTLSTFSLLLHVGPIIRCMLFLHISAGQTRNEILSMFIPFVEECLSHCSLEQITSVILNYSVRAGSVIKATSRALKTVLTQGHLISSRLKKNSHVDIHVYMRTMRY